MKKVYKYPLNLDEPINFVVMPEGAQILCVQVQQPNGNTEFQTPTPCLWALVDAGKKPKEMHKILTYGTGHQIHEENLKYIGSYQLDEGLLIFHVFEG